MSPWFQNPEVTVEAFLGRALAHEEAITAGLGHRWTAMYRSIENHIGHLRFSDESSDAAFQIDPTSGEFVFYTGGFHHFRSAMLQLFGAEIHDDAQVAYLIETADVTYALHEVYHCEQGLSQFSIVQDHKKVPSGRDEIGKMDHAADIASSSFLAAVRSADLGDFDRAQYLMRFRNFLYLANRAAPLAFGVPDDAFHKQKRRLLNWLVHERTDDALRNGCVAEVEQTIAPLDAPLWAHFQRKTGDVVLLQQEPIQRVLGTAKVNPKILWHALLYREQMDRGELVMAYRALLHHLRVDADSLKVDPLKRHFPTEAS
jgi:hypothetical protein